MGEEMTKPSSVLTDSFSLIQGRSTKTVFSHTCGRGYDKTLISPDGQLLPYSRAKHKNSSLAHLWERVRVRAKHVNVGVKNPNLQIFAATVFKSAFCV